MNITRLTAAGIFVCVVCPQLYEGVSYLQTRSQIAAIPAPREPREPRKQPGLEIQAELEKLRQDVHVGPGLPAVLRKLSQVADSRGLKGQTIRVIPPVSLGLLPPGSAARRIEDYGVELTLKGSQGALLKYAEAVAAAGDSIPIRVESVKLEGASNPTAETASMRLDLRVLIQAS